MNLTKSFAFATTLCRNIYDGVNASRVIGKLTRAFSLSCLLAVTAFGQQHQQSGALWYNPSSGQVGAWVQDSAGDVTGNLYLDATCTGCAPYSKLVGTGDFNTTGHQDVLWYNATTGNAGIWWVNGRGHVFSKQDQYLDAPCDTDNGCAPYWTPVGVADFNGDGYPDVLWWNTNTGQVGFWLLDSKGSGHVSAKQNVQDGMQDAICRPGCAVVGAGDFNGHGYADVVTFDSTIGQIDIWLLDGHGNIAGHQYLHCDVASVCNPSAWQIVGTGDFDNDGNQDILWYNAGTGQVGSWLLDGTGGVKGYQYLGATCPASGCPEQWILTGATQFGPTLIYGGWHLDDSQHGTITLSGEFFTVPAPGQPPQAQITIPGFNEFLPIVQRGGTFTGLKMSGIPCGGSTTVWATDNTAGFTTETYSTPC